MNTIEPQATELFVEIGKEILKETGKQAGKPFAALWQNFQWRQAEERYRQKLIRDYGWTRILGKVNTVLLNKVYTRVYVWNKLQVERRFNVEQLEELFRKQELDYDLREEDGVEVVRKEQYLFLLGKPGAGKTTFLRWLTTQTAQRYFDHKYLPIFITLKEVADNKRTILEQIISEFTDCDFPNAEQFVTTLLKRGNAVVLLDGLDEVQVEGGQQEGIINDVLSFVKRYSRNRYIMTCRLAAVTYQFERFTYVEMSDFDAEQIDEYISLYFSDDEETGIACRVNLQHESHRPLLELAKSPLLLSLMCLNYEEQRTFPIRRVELYEEALTALLQKWDNSRKIIRYEPYKELFVGRKKQLYARLAYENFIEGKYFVEIKNLVTQTENFLHTIPELDVNSVDGELFLQAMVAQHGIIVERAYNIYAFSHLTFQEYYTARYIIEHNTQNTLNDLLIHSSDPRWREVLLLVVSMLGNADDFFIRFLDIIWARTIGKDGQLSAYIQCMSERTSYYPTLTKIEVRFWGFYLLLNQTLASEYLDRVFSLTFARALYKDLNTVSKPELDHDIELSLVYAHDILGNIAALLGLSINLNLNLNLDLDHNLDLNLDLEIANTLNLDVDLLKPIDNTASEDSFISLERVLLWLPFFRGEACKTLLDISLSKAREVQLTKLEEQLKSLIPIDGGDYLENQEIFASQVYNAINEYRGIPLQAKLTRTQIGIVTTFLKETKLLLDCLDKAAVTNRVGIKCQALMPRNI